MADINDFCQGSLCPLYGLYELSDWRNEVSHAQEAHIDAFALNMAYGVESNERSVANAFKAAEALNFHLFFSFDYAGNGSWPQAAVTSLLQNFSSSTAYYQYNDRPFASTFEGSGNAQDWVDIKNVTRCFFVPDWSSVGAKTALELADGVADGLFSWEAWPSDGRMDTFADVSYMNRLKEANKPYMMPASPWFYTNMPHYDKNWAFHGDNLWYDRWVEVGFLEPEWVEIISWNDYGESHYIGPLNEKGYGVFTAGKAPYNYARNMPHDGWRVQLPFVIDLYKNGTASITEESLVVWYRLQPRDACSGGNTTDTAMNVRAIEKSDTWLEDKIFFSALLGSNASVKVDMDNSAKSVHWDKEPYDGVGIYHGSFAYDRKHLGEPIITISREKTDVITFKGRALTTTCTDKFANYNAWVGNQTSKKSISAVSPDLPLTKQVCIEGLGSSNFSELCHFSCKYGYCPLDTCYCTAMGAAKDKPKATKDKGTPRNGDDSYEGLCSFGCYYGFCPQKYCNSSETSHGHKSATPTCKGGRSQATQSSVCTHANGGTKTGDLYFSLSSWALFFGVYIALSVWVRQDGLLI
ncbi:uncharacterized protein N7469_010892 [Penicillium citrinum]|uniref:Uncharacterized protein n=1 Tax=Penicillium citrinum TaxID=5077 RepID=A0A9W9THZ2_PENCI|nr:uncharacterized protein N7469_010892 [Penicillium citrinum]KAJ5222005.1 hypothetical protein N7469_010892 [Penicillium citrinum]